MAEFESLTEVRLRLDTLVVGGRFFSSCRVWGLRPSIAAFHPVAMVSPSDRLLGRLSIQFILERLLLHRLLAALV